MTSIGTTGPPGLEALRRSVARLAADGIDTADPLTWRDAAVLAALTTAQGAGDDAGVLDLAAGYDTLLTWEPVSDSSGVRLETAGSAERRRRGSFATPAHLAAVLARHALPDAAETGPAPRPVPRVVDPACGTGALLSAAFDRLVELGHSPATALAGLYGVDTDPVAAALCRARLLTRARRLDPGLDRDARAGLARRVVVGDALLGPGAGVGEALLGPQAVPGALVWHEVFPEVLAAAQVAPSEVTGWCGGFDAVVANPPWERLKVFRREGGGAVLEALRDKRFDASRMVRTGGRHPLTGVGEVNAYLPFVETCWRLLAADGRAGLLVPAGIAADRSAAALMGALLSRGSLAHVHLLRPDRALFDGVSSRIGAAVLALRSGPGPGAGRGRAHPPRAEVAVDVVDAASPPPQRWSLEADLPRLVNPNTATLPLCGSARDADLLTAAHRRWPVLVRRGPDGAALDNPWQLRLVTPLHMTRDAVHFRSEPGPGLLPLWEAKHAGLLDHRGGSRRDHRYWVEAALFERRWPELAGRGWLAGYRNVTTTEAPRTLLPTPLPVVAVGNSLPLLDAPRLPLLLAVLAALPIDYLVRQKHAGANLNFFKLEQAAVPAPDVYDDPAPWQPEISLERWLLTRFAAAVRWEPELDALAAELAARGVDVAAATAELEGVQALAEIDAAHAVLLGWTREDLAHVLTTFAALAERERRAHGRFTTGARVLAAYDRLR